MYTVLGTCTEGHRITSLISDTLLYPVIFFAYNDRGNSTFNRASIAQRLEGDFNVETFKNTLLNVIEMKQTHKRSPMQYSNAEIIEQQKRDLENLEKIEQMKRQQEKEEKEKERLAKIEEEQKEKEIQIKAQQAKNKLPDEPSKDDPNATLISEITYEEMLAKNLKVMDLTAVSLCMQGDIDIRVFNMKNPDNFLRVINGESIGTRISKGDK